MDDNTLLDGITRVQFSKPVMDSFEKVKKIVHSCKNNKQELVAYRVVKNWCDMYLMENPTVYRLKFINSLLKDYLIYIETEKQFSRYWK